MTAANAIETRGLAKRYGSTQALDALDLDVPAGSILGLLGPAGSGKSTLVRMLSGLVRPNAGSALLGGERLRSGDGIAARRRLGVLLQEPGLPDWMTARELLAFMADLAGIERPALATRIDAVAGELALADALDRSIGELPSPIRGRLGIAQALVGEPEILLLDEPFHWLDPEGRLEVRALLAGLRGRVTVVLATHRLADVEGLCDHVALLDGGRLAAKASTADFLAAHAPPVYVIEVGAAPGLALEGLVARLRAEPWVAEAVVMGASLRVAVNDDARASRELLPEIVATGLTIAGVRRARPSIEAVAAGIRGDAGRGAAAGGAAAGGAAA